MRKSKRKNALILLVTFFIFIVTVGWGIKEDKQVYASTSGHTRQEAKAWIEQKAATHWAEDIDGEHGCQCVDLIMAYYDYLLGYHVGGNACAYMTNDLPPGWHRENMPSTGAIVVWDAKGGRDIGENGHVGLVTDADGTIFYSVETNVLGNHDPAATYRHNIEDSWSYCFIVPFSDGKTDTEAPKIANIRVTAKSDGSGYKVTCDVSDDNKELSSVKVAVWTQIDDQDDLQWITMKKDTSGKYYANVKFSDHKNASVGVYVNHIYATDTSGNQTVSHYNYNIPGSYKTGYYRTDCEGTVLNVRNKPGTLNSSIVSTLAHNTRINVLEVDNNWGRIGDNQWVCLDYCIAETTSISSCTVTLQYTSVTYDGTEKKPSVTVKNGATTLTNGTHYTVSYSNNKNAGTATVTITGKGSYTGTKNATFTINKAAQTVSVSANKTGIYVGDIATLTASGIGAITYKSSNTSIATVSADGKVTGVGPGKATITVTAAGDANRNSGTKTIEITVSKKNQTVTATASASSIQIGKTATITASGKGAISYGSSNEAVATVSADGTVTAVSAGKVTITVTASGDSTTSAASTTLDLVCYTTVTNFSAVAKTATGIKLSWQKNPNATGYVIYRKNNDGSYSKVKTLSSAYTSWTDTTANVEGVKYTYCMKSYSKIDGTVYYSGKSSAKTTYFVASTNISSVAASTTGMKITWEKNANATGYLVYRMNSKGSYDKIATIDSNATTSYIDTKAITDGSSYTYYVKVMNKVGTTNYYSAGSGSSTGIFVAQPTISTVTRVDSGIKITWSKNTNATGYVIYRKTDSGSYTKIKVIANPNTVSYTDTTATKKWRQVYLLRKSL